MQKNDKFYTYLLSHSTKTKIYIRRIEVSKKLLHFGLASLVLTIGIFTIGFSSGIIKNNFLAGTDSFSQNNLTTARLITFSKPEYKQINYDRPASAKDFSANSGGPLTDYRLTESESEAEEIAMESQLRMIEATGNPAFLPKMWAHLGKINNEFGYRHNPFSGRGYEFHGGMDIDGEQGNLIVASSNGLVIKAEWHGGYGNLIEIDHGNGLTTRYGHLSQINVPAGTVVTRGQVIGLLGSTGRSTGPHLHFEVRLNDKAINPRRFLPPELPEIRALNAE